jgi:CRP/FNR family transcriptional regulator, anaerobic regulatory protein
MSEAAVPEQPGDWTELFPALAGLDNRTLSGLREGTRRMRLPRGFEPFRVGAPCESYFFILAGSLRVQVLSESGREFVLYRVAPGETCLLTTACLLAGDNYPASAMVEADVEAAVLPAPLFAELLDRSAAFRRFVFQTYGRRLVGLMSLIDEVVFRRLDVRLADFLIAASAGDRRITATHYQMAVELGSAREVISRMLKDFERRGWVALGRGYLHVTEPDALRAFVASRVE